MPGQAVHASLHDGGAPPCIIATTNPHISWHQKMTLEAPRWRPTAFTFIYHFTSRLTHFCDKFSDNVQIMELSIEYEETFQYIHQVLTNCCLNLKQLRILCEIRIPSSKKTLGPLPPQPKLKSFLLNSTLRAPIPTLTNFIQIVVNASPNLREVKIPWGICPNFENSKSLDSLTIALDNLNARDFAVFKTSGFSRMLNQVADHLVSLCIGESDAVECIYDSKHWTRIGFLLPRKMPKLQKYRNVLVDVFQFGDVLQDLENMPVLTTLVIGKTNNKKSAGFQEFLQPIFDSGKIFGSLKNLTILELHDPRLLEGLKTTFPNLVKLEVACITKGFHGKESEMKLGVVLKACGGWEGLKRMDLWLPIYPEKIKDAIPALLEGRELYKGLKTLNIMGNNAYKTNVKQDLKGKELDLFKELLLAMKGVDDVIISYLRFYEQSERNIFNIMVSNNLDASKFRIFEGKSTRLGSD